jgi:hypothetical protein
MSKIINFNKARIAAYLRYTETHGHIHKNLPLVIEGNLPSYSKKYVGYQATLNGLREEKKNRKTNLINDFNQDLELLTSGFQTQSSLFMFPTVMSKYRKGINPVTALYNELQKTLFYFNKSNATHRWILKLFKDSDWFNALIKAIDYDYASISRFQQRHLHQVSNKHIERELSVLNNVKENLLHYKEVFLLMTETTDRYLK